MTPVRRAGDVAAEPVPAGSGTTCQVLIGPGEAPAFALRRFTMAPGGGMPRHTNAVEHEQYVLEGQGRITIGEVVHEVGPGDVVYIPAGTPHGYRNVGERPFVFLCAVPNRPDRVMVLEEAPPGT